MADETTFERLVAALQRDVERQCADDAVQQRLRAPNGPSSSELLFLTRDDHDGSDLVSVHAIIRVVLTELRKVTEDTHNPVLKAARSWYHPYVEEHWESIIDAILAQAGGSGG